MIAWIYHNVKLFAKKRVGMYPPTRVLYVQRGHCTLRRISPDTFTDFKFFSAFAKKIHKTFEALAQFFLLITAAVIKLMSFYSPLTRTMLIFQLQYRTLIMFTFVFHLQVQMQAKVFIYRPINCSLHLPPAAFKRFINQKKRKQNTNSTDIHFRVLKPLKNIKLFCNYCELHIHKLIFLFQYYSCSFYILAS